MLIVNILSKATSVSKVYITAQGPRVNHDTAPLEYSAGT